MVTTLRAALSVVMLIGFYILALVLIGGLGVATYLLFEEHAGHAAVKLGYVTIVAGAGVVVVLWRVLRAKFDPMDGVEVHPDQAPQLWQTVRDLATAANTRPPDEIRLVAFVNAAVSEDSRLLGLIGGRRRLYLGVPLLQALTVTQLRSILAHELGHYSRNHTRLAVISYRGRMAVEATSQSTGAAIGWVLKQYAKLYRNVQGSVSRRQELEADELSVRAAGRANAKSALREIPVIRSAWGFYEDRVIEPGWEAGYAPLSSEFFPGFGHLIEARADELTDLREEPPPSTSKSGDTHPSVMTRLAAMDTMPDVTVYADTRTARDLLPMFDNMCATLADKVLDVGDRRRLPFEDFRSVATLVEDQHQADLVYRAAARLSGQSSGLGSVLDLVAAGRLAELAEEFFPNATKREAPAKFTKVMGLLLRVAAVRSNVARWQNSWSGEATLLGNDGQPLDLSEVASLAVSPQTLETARARLAAMGIDVAAAVVVEKVASARGGDVIAGLANVSLNGAPHDLIVLDNGLILVSAPKKTDGGKQRLAALVHSAPVTELARANTFIPFEEIASATIVKVSPIRVDVTTRSGQTLAIYEAWTGDRLAKDSAEVFKKVMDQFVATP